MTPDRQNTHNLQRGGGSLRRPEPSANRSHVDGFSLRSDDSLVGSQGCQGRGPGLWYCSEDGTDRPWMATSAASVHPLRTPKARGARPRRSIPWQPASWGGKTTYKTTHKTTWVYRPGHPSGTPPDTPFGPHLGVGSGSAHINHLCCQPHAMQSGSGRCCLLCFGLPIHLGSQRSSASLQTSLRTKGVEAFCPGWSRHRFATLVSSHSQGSDFGSSSANDSGHLKAERYTSCFKTHLES